MLSLYQESLLLLVVTVIQVTSSLTPISKKVELTLYTDAHNWNEGQAICESIGGNLYSLDLAEKGVVLVYYMDSSAWPGNSDVYVGLHYPAGESGSKYGWIDSCVSLPEAGYSYWKTNEPKNTATSRCVVADKNWQYWKSTSCTDDGIFLCEKKTDPCTFRPSNEKPVTSGSYETLTTTAANMAGCQTNCLTQTQNNKNCWAASWTNIASNNCDLHFTDDPFFFVSPNVVADGTERLMVKECYSFSVETSASTTSQSSIDPVEGCPAFDTTTTTTTTTPTTTTTTTTTPTTTSTSTTSTTTSTTTTATTPTTTTSPTTTTTSPTTTTTSTSSSSTTSPTSTSTTTPTTTSTSATTPTTTTTSATTPTTTTTPTTSTTQTTTSPSTSTNTQSTTSSSTTSTTETTSTTTSTQTSSTTSTTPTTVSSSTTTTSTTTTSSFSTCKCKCSKYKGLLSADASNFANLTTAEKVAFLQLRLKQDISKLSATVRKKSSAKDDRPQSKAVGYVGVTFLCVVFVPIVLSDTIKVLVFMYEYLKRKLSEGSTNAS